MTEDVRVYCMFCRADVTDERELRHWEICPYWQERFRDQRQRKREDAFAIVKTKESVHD